MIHLIPEKTVHQRVRLQAGALSPAARSRAGALTCAGSNFLLRCLSRTAHSLPRAGAPLRFSGICEVPINTNLSLRAEPAAAPTPEHNHYGRQPSPRVQYGVGENGYTPSRAAGLCSCRVPGPILRPPCCPDAAELGVAARSPQRMRAAPEADGVPPAGQKAAGWENRGTVDAVLNQQLQNMQQYGQYTDSYTDVSAHAVRADASCTCVFVQL